MDNYHIFVNLYSQLVNAGPDGAHASKSKGAEEMGPKERHNAILGHLEHRGACSYEELAGLTGVSSMTVRRDIEKLSIFGQVIKVLGGAQRANASSDLYESQLASRLAAHSREKHAITLKALEYIRPGQTISLDGSTTCLQLAKLISSHCKGVTVITNSLLACSELGRNKDNTILLVGGEYDPTTLTCAGPTTEEQIGDFFIDIAFFSTKGFLTGEGTFESSVGLFRVKKLMARQSNKVFLLVDHSKFSQRALCKVLNISEIDTVITDSRTSEADISKLKAAGLNVIVTEKADEKEPINAN